jgi:recombination protein RecR
MASSALLEELIKSLQVMPGIGPVSATRIAYYLLDKKREEGLMLAKNLELSLKNISLCPCCRNYTDLKDEPCNLCADEKRNLKKSLCIVENPEDVEAIEAMASYHGLYFILHGHLSPIDGVGPLDLGLDILKRRLETLNFDEVILATSQTVEGEATASYIALMAKKLGITVSKIATGVPIGGNLGSVDGNTLMQSFNYRRPL